MPTAGIAHRHAPVQGPRSGRQGRPGGRPRRRSPTACSQAILRSRATSPIATSTTGRSSCWRGTAALSPALARGRRSARGHARQCSMPARSPTGSIACASPRSDISGRSTTTSAVIELRSGEDKLGRFATTRDRLQRHARQSAVRSRPSVRLACRGDWGFLGLDVDLQTSVGTARDESGALPGLRLGSRAYLTLPTGERAGFTFAPVTETIGSLTFYRPAWIADGDHGFTLDSVDRQLRRIGSAFYDVESGFAYNPAEAVYGSQDYSLTAPDGTRYTLDSVRGTVGDQDCGRAARDRRQRGHRVERRIAALHSQCVRQDRAGDGAGRNLGRLRIRRRGPAHRGAQPRHQPGPALRLPGRPARARDREHRPGPQRDLRRRWQRDGLPHRRRPGDRGELHRRDGFGRPRQRRRRQLRVHDPRQRDRPDRARLGDPARGHYRRRQPRNRRRDRRGQRDGGWPQDHAFRHRRARPVRAAS